VLVAVPWWCFGIYRASSGGCVAEVVGYYDEHEWALGVVKSGKSLHRSMVGMMAAALGCQSPYWGNHGEALCYHCVGLSG
jgi:hypothetical protein